MHYLRLAIYKEASLGNAYTRVVHGTTQGHALLVRPESLVTCWSIEQRISDHYGVLFEAEWEENYC